MTSFDTEERNCTKSLNPNKNVFQVCEIFYSIQGEGLMQGVPSILIRLQGCNLNCKWCDTNTSDFVLMSKNDILAQFKMFSCKNVIITGGEPTLLEELNELIIFLKSNGFHITVETNATIKRNLDCDLVSMSPKLSHSGNTAQRINIDAIRYYVSHNNYQ